MAESRRQRMDKRRGQLDFERSSFISHWRELSEFNSPRSSRFLTTDRNRGDKKHNKIINGTSTLALRTARSGMMSGITSPARPWFMLQTPDPDLNEFAPVKAWLYDCTTRMRSVLSKSNFYNAMPILYHDILLYSTHAMAVLEDTDTIVRFYPFPIGSYMLANSDRLKVDTCYRDFSMTARQMAQRFGKEKLSSAVQALLVTKPEAWIDVVHAIEPNEMHDGSKLESKFKRHASVYYEKGGDSDKTLSEAGFDTFPIIAPRWDLTGEDVYGSTCPGMESLGDVKELQLTAIRKSELKDKLARPPMNAPSSMRNRRASILPGDITFVDVNQGQQGFTPTFQVDPSAVTALSNDSMILESRIKRAFFEDLFLMVSSYSGTQPRTAEEIAALKTEQLLMLGPVLERLNDEALSPTIDRVFDIMLNRGMLPPPPKELQGMELKVEYTSIIAQAQKLVGAASIERFASFVGNLAGASPNVLDRIDMDEVVDAYADITGVPPKIVVPFDEAEKVRQARYEKQQQMEQMQSTMVAAQGAELLSKTDMSSDNALTRIASGITGAGA